MKKILMSGMRVIGIFLLVCGVAVYLALQGTRYKGEFAASVSALRNMSALAETYKSNSNTGYDGFCEDESFVQQKDFIEAINRTGILNWAPYTVVCIAGREEYAISITSFVNLFGDKTPYTHLCISSSTENTLVEQNKHITEPHCESV